MELTPNDRKWTREALKELFASRAAEAPEEARDHFRRRHMAELGVPSAYLGARLSDFVPADIKGGEWLFDTPPVQPRNVLIFGPNGAGKTHLAAAIAGEWGAVWRSAGDLVRRVKATYHRDAEETELSIINSAIGYRLMVLDDITAVALTEHGISTLLAVIGGRLEQVKTTIVTSYHAIRQINAIDSSLASRLGAFVPVKIVGGDRRSR